MVVNEATGHSSAAESRVLIAAAQAAHAKHIVVAHALFPSLRASDTELRAMAERGAWIELAWLMHHTPKSGPGLSAALAGPMVPLARARPPSLRRQQQRLLERLAT